MSGFSNSDGTWLALLAVGAVGVAGVARRRGSRALADLTDDQLVMLRQYGRAGPHEWDEIQTRLRTSGVDSDDYMEEQVWREQDRRKHVILGRMFGGNVGNNADWIDSAWHVGPGNDPNRVGGDYYVVEDEDNEDTWWIARRWYVGGEPQEQAAAKAAAQAAGQQFYDDNDYIQEVATFTSFEALMAHLRANLESYRPRQWLGASKPQR